MAQVRACRNNGPQGLGRVIRALTEHAVPAIDIGTDQDHNSA